MRKLRRSLIERSWDVTDEIYAFLVGSSQGRPVNVWRRAGSILGDAATPVASRSR
jgi:hypothetical protein